MAVTRIGATAASEVDLAIAAAMELLDLNWTMPEIAIALQREPNWLEGAVAEAVATADRGSLN